MIKIGNKDVTDIRLGGRKVLQVYKGDNLIWPIANTPIPEDITVKPSEANVCDVVFANKNTNKVIIIKKDRWDTTLLPPNVWVPIAVVVIPGPQGAIKDGTNTRKQCGAMSLKIMSATTPEEGTTAWEALYFGMGSMEVKNKYDGLGRYDSYTGNGGLIGFKHVATTTDNTLNDVNGYSESWESYIPRQDAINGDALRKFAPYAPSPYKGAGFNTGDFNPAYSLTSGVISIPDNNALSDFRGIINTYILTEISSTLTDWKTSTSIVNNAVSCYIAACATARFHTPGTKAFKDCSKEELKKGSGFWYFPACGEFGYLPPRFYDINDTLRKLIAAYGSNVGRILSETSSYWTSTSYGYESSNDAAYSWKIGLEWGNTLRVIHNDRTEIHAFIRLDDIDM